MPSYDFICIDSGPAAGAQIAKPPKHADALIAHHTKKALAEA